MEDNICLGMTMRRGPTIEGAGCGIAAPIHSGTVVYIHPEHRFYVLEFEALLGRKFRESFHFQHR